ncbi:MAG: hypothetical protein ACUZ9M_10110 [Candidatus Scalindua sp.]
MENKTQDLGLKGFSVCSIALPLIFYAIHVCPIVPIDTEKQISSPINHSLDFHPKYYIFGLESTITGNLGCPEGS